MTKESTIAEHVEEAVLQGCKKRRGDSKVKLKLDPRRKPVMSKHIEGEVEALLIQYTNFSMWREWGMDSLRKNGAAILLEGPPGTGKTTIAEYIAKRIGRGLATINMKDIGGKAPGHCERMLDEAFQRAHAEGNRTIFIDECESVLWDRTRAGSDSMWMVGVIDELLMQVAKYKGAIIFATNVPQMIDSALRDRCFAILQVNRPDKEERIQLWKNKMPERFPLKLTPVQIQRLAEYDLSGRQIENVIVREASFAMRESRKPTFITLCMLARELSCVNGTIQEV